MSDRGPRDDVTSAAIIAVAIVMGGAAPSIQAQSAAGANDPVAVPARANPSPPPARDAEGDVSPQGSGSPQGNQQAPGRPEASGDAAPGPPRLPEYRQEQRPLGARDGASGGGGDAEAGDSGVGGWGLQTVMALAVVIGLILLLRGWLRRASGAPAAPTAKGLVEVLGRTTVGPKTQVLFLRINERVIVAAQTPAGINTLTCIDEPDEVANLLAQADADRPQSISQGFGKLLKQFERDGGVEASSADRGADGMFDRARGELNGLLGRLKHMGGEGTRDDERDPR